MNAHAINAGRFPNISNGKDTDFFFIKAEDAEAIPQLIVSLVRDRLSRAYSYNPKEIQVLTPMQRGNVGAGNLNTELQNALNPSGESLTRGGYTFRRGDKVMQIRNNYDKNVFNAVNGKRDFPMLSVYKFPQALAVADYCHKHNISLNDTIRISADDLNPDTWSPMRDKYGRKDISLPLSEILAYSVQQSDNNACDVLFRLIGGPQVADSLMKCLGYDEIHILNTEDEMYRDPYLCYANRATPLQMASLFDQFYRREMRHDSRILEALGAMMMSCNTGNNRLPLPLMPTNAMVGHKTGTGGMNSQGRITGVNDAGYVFLPNKQGYAIAVFVADSGYDMAETENIIADISEIVFQSLMMLETVIGEYEDRNDGSTLTISKKYNGRIKVEIGLNRLTSMDDGEGVLSDNGLTFSATDAAGNPIYGEIVVEGNRAILTFTQSTWEYLPNGTTYTFQRK